MYNELFEKGFVFFDGVTIPDDLYDYFFDLKNFTQGTGDLETYHEIVEIPADICKRIEDNLPEKIKDFIKGFRVYWGAKCMGKGAELYPHSDVSLEEYSYGTGPAIVVFWICPKGVAFEGRKFVWGEIKDMSKIPGDANPGSYTNQWEDPNLTKLGEVTPVTGHGVVVDRLNPLWWHGVTPLTTDTRVITISGYL